MQKKAKWLSITGGTIAILWAVASPAFAQRATENAVTQAEDAFGTSVGDEQIGLYSSQSVRGFSPTVAGNVRIEGLYFDQVTQLNPRLAQSSEVRVGIAAQGYAFPAPTGVVDYSLRTPGSTPILSTLWEINTRGTGTIEFDGTEPLIGDTLSLGIGAGFHRDVEADGSDNYQTNQGVMLRWNPAPNIEFLPFWSRSDTYDQHVGQVYSPSGPFLPPVNPGRHLAGPYWAINQEFDSNFGLVAKYEFLPDWTVRAGIFRSTQDLPKNFFTQLADLSQQGQGELNVVSNPESDWGSTSGEARLEHTISEGPRTHRMILSLRMRDWNAVDGGADSLDLGQAAIGQRLTVPQPAFQYTAQTHDHVSETVPGFSYQLAWQDLGILGVSLQNPQYRKRTLIPGAAPAISAADPWFLNLALTADLSPTVAIYADQTRGLEDNGIAPQNATNRNQALPAITTRQKDAGVRWLVAPGLRFVTGLFDIHKPYFNLNPNNLFTGLGDIENKGLEVSFDGHILQDVDIVAGSVFSQPKVSGEAVQLGIVGMRPVGIPSRQAELNVNWTPASMHNLSFDFTADNQTRMVATIDDALSIPDRTVLSADARYSFRMGNQPASLRLWFENMLDARYWDLNDAGSYDLWWNSGRRIDLRLIVDI